MATKYPRIAITADPELAEAIERVRPLLGERDTSKVVRELALRGAESLVEEHDAKRAALERIAEWSTSDNPPFDREVLKRIDELAWGE